MLAVYADREGFSPIALATLYSRLGETDEALAALERSYEAREPALVYLKRNPDFDPLHGDPRFEALVRRVGFPES
jgi:hypothetical protein